MKTYLVSSLILFTTTLLAQTGREADRVMAKKPETNVLERTLPFDKGATRKFSDYFMKKAMLVDASGKIFVGREQIVRWHEARKASATRSANDSETILSSLERQIRPDLMVVLAKTKVSSAENQDSLVAELSYNILWRKIDGKWYIESCTIVQSTPVQDDAIAFFHPGMLDPSR